MKKILLAFIVICCAFYQMNAQIDGQFMLIGGYGGTYKYNNLVSAGRVNGVNTYEDGGFSSLNLEIQGLFVNDFLYQEVESEWIAYFPFLLINLAGNALTGNFEYDRQYIPSTIFLQKNRDWQEISVLDYNLSVGGVIMGGMNIEWLYVAGPDLSINHHILLGLNARARMNLGNIEVIPCLKYSGLVANRFGSEIAAGGRVFISEFIYGEVEYKYRRYGTKDPNTGDEFPRATASNLQIGAGIMIR